MKDKKKKSTSSGLTAREKMEARKKKLSEKGSGGNFIFLKEGTVRMRIKSPGDDEELGMEIISFYDPKTKRSINSPSTFNEPCPFMEKYQELKNSSDEDDKELAKLLIPKRKFVIGGVHYKDLKGKEVDEESVGKGTLIPSGVYQDIIDYYLDEDEWGDMTDDNDGYDIKITRSGKGKMDTKYSVSPCSKSKLPKQYRGPIDLAEIVRKSIPSYSELEEKLDEFLSGGLSNFDDDDDDRPKKKGKDKKKKKRGGDLPY